MLTPKDIRNILIANPAFFNWILFEHDVFANDIDTPVKQAMHSWGMKLLKMVAPKDNLTKVEWLRRAITLGEENE